MSLIGAVHGVGIALTAISALFIWLLMIAICAEDGLGRGGWALLAAAITVTITGVALVGATA